MSIVIINHSDVRGGSSVVSLRLLRALRSAGSDVKMLVVHKGSDDPDVVLAGNPLSRRIPFIAEHLRILADCRGDRTNLFKISLGTDGLPLDRHPLVRMADTVILNWVNQGMLSLDTIGRLAAEGKRIIWTMHDMWNATGVCHHAGTCPHWLEPDGCCFCPLLGHGASPNDASSRTWRSKRSLYEHSAITFVAVSSWLADCCRRSPLMKNCRIDCIPNAFPVDEFRLTPQRSRTELGLPEGDLIVMGAARIDDPIKGLELGINALNAVGKGTAVFFGTMRNPHALDGLKIPYVYLGPISNPDVLADIYAHARVVLSSSHYETLPGTLIEAQASGAYPVAFDSGGQKDIITHPSTGWLAVYPKVESLTEGIRHGLDSAIDRAELRTAASRFDARQIAERYLALINS